MEQNPSELENAVPAAATESAPKQSAPKKPRTRVPKAARAKIEAIENEKGATKGQAGSNTPGGDSCSSLERGSRVLKCECGCDIMPETNGLYPSRCPECGTWNDFRGVKFLEQSANILVCDKCGGLTLITPETVCCEHCGAH